MIDAMILAAALHATPKPPAPGTARYVWCAAFHEAPAIWGKYATAMRLECRGVKP